MLPLSYSPCYHLIITLLISTKAGKNVISFKGTKVLDKFKFGPDDGAI